MVMVKVKVMMVVMMVKVKAMMVVMMKVKVMMVVNRVVTQTSLSSSTHWVPV